MLNERFEALTESEEPTAEPTVAPTEGYSLEPTAEPTAEPTTSSSANTPTYGPTSTRPSARPTFVPTQSPSVQTSPLITFQAVITLNGVTTATLDVNGQKAVINATAVSMSVSSSVLRYVSDVSTVITRRKLSSSISLFVTTYRVVATTELEMLLSETTYPNTDALFAGLTGLLDQAVQSGTFDTQLNRAATAFNAPALDTTTASGVTYSTPVVDNPRTSSSKDDALDDGAIAGIVIGAFFFVVLVAAIVYLFVVKESTHTKVTDSSQTEQSTRLMNRSRHNEVGTELSVVP